MDAGTEASRVTSSVTIIWEPPNSILAEAHFNHFIRKKNFKASLLPSNLEAEGQDLISIVLVIVAYSKTLDRIMHWFSNSL